MLSDAAGAVFMSGKKNKKGKSLRVDWIEHISYAGQMDVCMYAGGVKKEDGKVIGWRSSILWRKLWPIIFSRSNRIPKFWANMLCASP